MENPYIYYIPIYPDDDRSEALMHLFSGAESLDGQILNLLEELDSRESQGEGVDYVRQLEERIGLKRIVVHELHRSRISHS